MKNEEIDDQVSGSEGSGDDLDDDEDDDEDYDDEVESVSRMIMLKHNFVVRQLYSA